MIETRNVPIASYSGCGAAVIGLPHFAYPGIHMINNNATPLEHLAAFAIVFVTGVLGTAILGRYIDAVRRDAAEDACARND